MIKTVLVDIDNTLLDFDAGTKLAIKTLFPKYGIPYSDGVLKTFAAENAKLWDKIEKGELTKDELRRIRWNTIFRVLGVECDGEKFEKDYEDIVANTAVPIDGSEELLKYLKQNFSVYAVTNGWLDKVKVSEVHDFEQRLFEKLENQKPQLLKRFEEGFFEDEDVKSLEETLEEMTR